MDFGDDTTFWVTVAFLYVLIGPAIELQHEKPSPWRALLWPWFLTRRFFEGNNE